MQKLKNYLICGLFLSLAWPIRGQFGHLKGAMIPGALAAASIALLALGNNWKDNFGKAVITGALGFGLGGFLGYGKLIDEILATNGLRDELPQLLKLFSIGALWGTLGMTSLGYGYSEKGMGKSDTLLLAAGFLITFVLLNILNLGEYAVPALSTFLGILLIHNFFFKKSNIIVIFGLSGFFSVGLGFLVSVILLYYGRHRCFGDGPPWWTLRDQMIGLAAGIGTAWAYHRSVKKEALPLLVLPEIPVQKSGFIFYTTFIPLLNWIMVSRYWYSPGKLFDFNTFLILSIFSVFLFGLAAACLANFRQEDYHEKFIRTLSACTLFFIWFLSFLAIVKQVLIFGRSIWEAAYPIFLAESAILSLFLIPRLFRSKTLRF